MKQSPTKNPNELILQHGVEGMKVLYIQDTDWIRRNVMQHNHLAEMMVMRGIEVKVIDFQLLWREDYSSSVFRHESSVNVARIYPESIIEVMRASFIALPFLDYLSVPLFLRRFLKKVISDFKPDIVIGDGILSPAIAARECRNERIPFVYYCLDKDYLLIEQGILRPLGKIIESNNIAKADLAISINEGLRDYTIRMGAKDQKTRVIRAGVDFSRFDSSIDGKIIRSRLGFNDEDIVLFFVGWLYVFSGLIELVKEIGTNKEENKEIKIVIVGDGDAYPIIKDLIKLYHLENIVKLTGKIPYDDVPKYIASSDFCLLPALDNDIMRDIVPIKMYEYLAMGKPVIATRLPGLIKEFGSNPAILYINNPGEALIAALNNRNKNEYEKLCISGKAFVKDLTWERIASEFIVEMEGIYSIYNEKPDNNHN